MTDKHNAVFISRQNFCNSEGNKQNEDAVLFTPSPQNPYIARQPPLERSKVRVQNHVPESNVSPRKLHH